MHTDYTLTKEQEDLKKRTHDFALQFKPYVAEWDAANRFPMDQVVDAARKAGILGITMPEEYGGQDLTVMDYVIAHEESIRTSQWQTLSEAQFSTSGPGPAWRRRHDDELPYSAAMARRHYRPGRWWSAGHSAKHDCRQAVEQKT